MTSPTLGLAACTLALLLATTAPAAPTVTRVERTPDGWRLLRDGRPYTVRGAGGDGSRELLSRLGGNSLRTWGADDLDRQLDEAARLGLSVTVGIWLGHERHGFRYDDPARVARQKAEALAVVSRYKGHPAVLAWGIGNEMEGDGTNPAVWRAVEDIAKEARRLDPDHPTMTVIAEIGGPKVKSVHELCPSVDVVGINSYGGAPSVPERYRRAGGTKPYLLTEFGPPGRWEIKARDWGAPPELSSTRKAESYRRAYEANVLGAEGLCLGSYAFLWGWKQEVTPTWMSLLLPGGERLAAADALGELWSGRPPANRCPEIRAFTLAGPDRVEPGATVRVDLAATDPEGDPLSVRWLLRREVEDYSSGGDREAAPPEFPEALAQGDATGATFRLPRDGGGYRAFVTITDGHGGAATANVPLLVKGPRVADAGAARKPALPLVVVDEPGRADRPYAPSGWMGNTAALALDEACRDRPHGGASCLRLTYRAADGWAGVVWQDPPNDWGDRPGGLDLRAAKSLRLWLRGAKGGETITVGYGTTGGDKRYPDTASGRREKIALTGDWQEVVLPLEGDRSRIKSGLVLVLTGAGAPVTIDVDDVRYE
jgi:hypothetical protein